MKKKSSKEYWWKAKSSSYESYLQRMSSLISSRGELVLHNRVSEVFKGFKVHDFERYGQRNGVLKWKFYVWR